MLRRLEDVLLTASITVGVSSVESIEGGLHITQDKLHTYILFYNNKVVCQTTTNGQIDNLLT